MIGKTATAAEAKVRASRTVQAKVRMPAALHRKLMRDADRSGQTLNAEILRRLEDSYSTDDTLKGVSETLGAFRFELSQQTEELKKLFIESAAKAYLRALDKAQNPEGKDND
jgi:Arc-like DNA binding domain